MKALPELTVSQAFDLAVGHHRAGQLREAEHVYRQILAAQPGHTDALQATGVIAAQTGRHDDAVNLFRQVIALNPNSAQAYCNLGGVLRKIGQLDGAIAASRQAIALKVGFAEAYNNLASALSDAKQLDQAIDVYQQAIGLRPDLPALHVNLGNALSQKMRHGEAIAAYGRAIALNPNIPDAHYGMGNALKDARRLEEAIAHWRRAVEINPAYLDAYNNLAKALADTGQFDAAIDACQRAIELRPDLAEPYNHLGNALRGKGQLNQAIDAYRHAITLRPDLFEAHSNLGAALTDAGRPEEAVISCRKAVALDPESLAGHNNLLYALYYDPESDSKQSLEVSRAWAVRQPLFPPSRPLRRERLPNRKLKVGYLSPFFCAIPEQHFILPLLSHHDREQFEITCYSRTARHDETTKRMQAHCDHWVDIRNLDTKRSVELLRSHDLDIAVNISRPADECLVILASRVALAQVNWLMFGPFTTGLEAMDYRISDPFVDPVGTEAGCYSERTVRLPETAWCYDPLGDVPAIGPSPLHRNGFLTFGSMNRFCKINPQVLATWAELMRAVPNSRLHILSGDGCDRRGLLDRFQTLGVSPGRVEFLGRSSRLEYLEQYNRIDVMLDTFPYGAHTTALDSLWMGVPVVTCLGRTALGRATASALQNLRMRELIAQTPADYIQIGKGFADQSSRLHELRRSLRQRMSASPLMDAPRFVHNLEQAYRQMWRDWCATAEVQT